MSGRKRMKLKFRHKVFLTFMLNSLAIVICMVVIARYYAFRNFEGYVNKVESERLNVLAETLGQEYLKSQNWAPVMENLGHWLAVSGVGPGGPPGDGSLSKPPFPSMLPGPPMPPGEGSPPPGGGPPFNQPPHGPPPFYGGGPPPPLGIPPHLSLMDAEKRPLTHTGPMSTEPASTEDFRALKPIMAAGKLVGWLGVRGHHERFTHLDAEFRRLQSETFFMIGGFAILLAVFVTFVLSRHLLAPVKELAAGTRALTFRRFETRVEVRTQDEFGQLATDFNAMVQALERYEQMRRQWIADISHELRTPLAVLRGEIEAMQDGVRDVTPEALESLHSEVLHVSRIVNDLHDISRIESGSPDGNKTAVNPLTVLDETLKSFATRFESSHYCVEVIGDQDTQFTIVANAVRLRQLFSNLLENALRYAPAPGTLKIFHEVARDSFSLHFEDTGPGVPEESLGRIFDRLYRVDKARSRTHGGSGLGLAICRSIVESYGGRIGASNVPSGGLRITMVFPMSAS
ncbi:MAG: ATP-binding protein [Syntrophobacter sp.]